MTTSIRFAAMQDIMIRKLHPKAMALGFRSLVWFLCLLLLCPPQMVLAADPVPAGTTNTTVSQAGNGVPVVNIATPNHSGLSHNQFTHYNVDPHGLVLNNGDMSEAYRQSQLAGQIAANPNLAVGNQANIILNEVTGNSRTYLKGFTEILGGRADVIVANPFGITSSGGGFINTDRASLVTGTPDMTGDTLNGFNIRGGDILITGTGINASAQQILNLVSRKFSIEGQVNAQTLNMVAGSNHWNHKTGEISSIAPDAAEPAPTWAIDSSALGGMYANLINMKATETGVGVRMQGDAAATASDFIITASGKIEIGSKISAARDLSITSANHSYDAISIIDANLTAGRDLDLNATDGGAFLYGGGFKANAELAYDLGQLNDRRSDTAGISDANKRYGNTVILKTSGSTSIEGVNYGAASLLQMEAAEHDIGIADMTSIYSDGSINITATGNNGMTFSKVMLKSPGDMNLISTTGSIFFNGVAGQGVQSVNGDISLFAGTYLNNFGTITADAGNIIARVDGTLRNMGTIYAHNLLDFGGKTVAKSSKVENGGAMLGGSLNIQTESLSINGNGSTLESLADMDVVADVLTLGSASTSTGRILAATSGTGSGNINSAVAFTNYGTLYSGYNLSVNAKNFKNMSTGSTSAAHDMTISSQQNIMNEGALYAGNDLTASAGNNFYNNSEPAHPLGTIGSGHDVSISAQAFVNSSYVDARNNITITAANFKNQVQDGASRTWGPIEDYTITFEREDGDYFYYTESFTEVEIFRHGAPQFTPHINGGSGGVVTIQGFDSGLNLGSVISGNTLRFIGNTGASFDNTDILLKKNPCVRTKMVPKDPNKQTLYADIVYTPIYQTAQKSYIRAENLYMGGFALTNNGSPSYGSPVSHSATGTTFPGLTLHLPTNPNGMFVTNKSSDARYLVETNPLYTNIDNFMGSDYLLAKYNFDADDVIKRLGDAGYETYLVSQQLVTQTGGNLLPRYSNEKEQMQGLMDSAANQSGKLGLKMGKKLSERQQSLLTKDMLWMVETVVDGQKVLSPVVYLAASTKQMFASNKGASISGTNVTLDLTSLDNTGNTISGKTLNVTTQGDITNVSGKISGTNVALTSTDGSIINKTFVEYSGGKRRAKTTVGKTADIVSTGELQLDAAKNIESKGANIASKGDASLTAGTNVILDTMQATTTSHKHFKKNDIIHSTKQQIGSTLSSGGNLTISAKKDITLAGSSIKAGGDTNLNAGKDIKILARDNEFTRNSTTTKSGLGVGGGLWGKETTSTENVRTKAVGSNISTGSHVNLSADKSATLQGAKLNSKGDIHITATDVHVTEARDTKKTTTHKEATSILSFSKGEGNNTSSSTDSSNDAGKVIANAETSSTHDAGGIDFLKTTTTDTMDKSTRAVASQLNAEQDLTISGKKDVVLRGAEVKTGGDASLSGQNVSILAAQDTHVSTSKTSTAKIGLYANTTNSADAEATAGVNAVANTGTANANANATAVANANSSTSIDFLRTKTVEKTAVDITNKGTTLSSGGNLTINSKKDLIVQGSDLSGETGVDITARNMSFIAAEDKHTRTSSTTQTSSGLYIDGKAKAKAQASGTANAGLGVNAGVSGSLSGKAEVSVGVQHKNSSTTDTEGSTTARVSSITSGSGSISRTAKNNITDVGTAIEAGGDFSQTAKTYDSKAATNTSYKTSSSSSDIAKAGVYAKAEAGVTGSAGVNVGLGLDGQPKAEAGAGAQAVANVGAGIKVSYDRKTSESSSASTEAVVSTIKTGGKITSVTSGKTSLEGTQISGGEGVAIEARSLDFKAAENTETSSSSVSNVNGAISAGLTRGSGKGFEASVSGGTKKTDTNESSSTAVVGGINSGGNISIKTKGDTRLEGTNLSAEGNTGIDAGGNITMDAARDTTSFSETSYDASASLNIGDSAGGGSGKSSLDAKVGGGYSKESASSDTAKAGSIMSGGTLDLKAGKNVTLEGTNMKTDGDATVSGKDGVTFNAARSTSKSKSTGVRAGVGIGTSKSTDTQGTSNSKSAKVTAEVAHSKANESIAEAGNLSSGGNLAVISGKDVTFEGTTLSAGNKASIDAKDNVNFKAAESTSKSSSVGVAFSVSGSKENKTPKTTPQTPTARTGTGGTQGSDGSTQSNKDLADWQKKHGNVMDQLKAKQASNTGSTKQQTSTTPGVPTNTQATDANTPTTETAKSIATGFQFRKKDQTAQQASSVSAGAGGITINASGGDVNLVGTNISTSGNADVTAKDNVNITTTKNTDKSFGITLSHSADKKSQKPKTAQPSGTKSTTGTTAKKGTPSSSVPTKQAGTVTKTVKPGTTGTAAKTGTTGTAAKTGVATNATTPPTGTATTNVNTGLSIGTTGTKTSAPSEWKEETGVSKTTAEDPDNTSSTFIGIGGGKSIRNQGASINTDGTVNIKSGGKTTLVNTNIETDAEVNIDATGGVEHKTVKDKTILHADTNSGPAAVNEGVSSVPMYDQSNNGVATTPGMAPATGVVPPVSMKNRQNGGATPPKP
ncbi:hemagglutinin repeat-containing protein [uncultured Pseudodesulfovibrio sp.]|uniref:hemagglutinin repeat-containing protein n=1 Tax=uncultured Pseudodesulfovibrio sp. TaxID=2035858 RepID=UPI0029C932D5|nr:hemagglutinin repeat-containing protein [uncultured Pseudodesulfovibrio sp.]